MTDLNDTLIDITRTAAQLHGNPVDLKVAKNCSHLWHTSNEHGLNVINFCPDCCEGRAK